MKQIVMLLSFWMVCLPLRVWAWQDEAGDARRVELQVVIPRGEVVSENARNVLLGRLNQAVVLNGLGSSESRFLLVPFVHLFSCRVTPSAPPMYTAELEVTCFIADRMKKTILQQSSIGVSGVADTKAGAVSQALSAIQARNGEWKKMIVKGKEKIVSYYEQECGLLMKKIESDIRRGRFDEAILELESLPQVNISCYEKSLELQETIDRMKLQEPYSGQIREAENALRAEPDVAWIQDNL